MKFSHSRIQKLASGTDSLAVIDDPDQAPTISPIEETDRFVICSDEPRNPGRVGHP